jgi:Hypervirulence associated proteins TUDOR domain
LARIAFTQVWANLDFEDRIMANAFKVGDHVTWNSEAGHVSGRVVKVHLKNVDYKGHVHHASDQDPQYEIKSDKSDHIALHKAAALKLLRQR